MDPGLARGVSRFSTTTSGVQSVMTTSTVWQLTLFVACWDSPGLWYYYGVYTRHLTILFAVHLSTNCSCWFIMLGGSTECAVFCHVLGIVNSLPQKSYSSKPVGVFNSCPNRYGRTPKINIDVKSRNKMLLWNRKAKPLHIWYLALYGSSLQSFSK